MSSNFRSFDRDTLFLMPPSVQDWLPKEHFARFVVEIVEQLDLRALRESYAGRGSAAYHPEMLVALLFYGYATGIRASRKIEAATYESVPFRFIAANTHPDHDTISDFRARFLPQLAEVFQQLLVLAHEMGCLNVGRVSLDGTKIRASASKHNALSLKRATELERRFRREADRMLELAEAADREDQDDEFDLPVELARREDRIRAIKEAKERIRAREEQRIARERAEREEAKAERRRFEASNGRRFETQPNDHRPRRNPNAQINLTDEDSRIMSSREGFVQAYNGQLAVDCDSMLVAACHRDATLRHDADQTRSAGSQRIADRKAMGAACRCGLLQRTQCRALRCQRYRAIYCDQPRSTSLGLAALEAAKAPRHDAGALAKMRHRLQTTEGRALYAQRKSTVEPVIGNIKRSMGFRQFLLRGIAKVNGEWNLACASWNVRRLHALSLA